MIKAIFLFSLLYFFSAKEMLAQDKTDVGLNRVISYGGIIRGDTTVKKIALVFTADEFGDGGEFILKILQQQHIQASFFFTGNFYKNTSFKTIIKKLQQDGNYLGSHSDKHLLYCDWMKRDSLLVTHDEFRKDLESSYQKLKEWNIGKKQARYFLPPYEWYNDSIAAWTKEMGLQLVNFSPGTRSNADYTYPEMGNKYVGSDFIMKSILEYEQVSTSGLNGFILLLHFGTDPRRTDKFYFKLPHLIRELKNRGYEFVRIDEMLN
jgi:peptidoglycan/xylan/chitin deacetylase (PgdA/CDA1 family)